MVAGIAALKLRKLEDTLLARDMLGPRQIDVIERERSNRYLQDVVPDPRPRRPAPRI